MACDHLTDGAQDSHYLRTSVRKLPDILQSYTIHSFQLRYHHILHRGCYESTGPCTNRMQSDYNLPPTPTPRSPAGSGSSGQSLIKEDGGRGGSERRDSVYVVTPAQSEPSSLSPTPRCWHPNGGWWGFSRVTAKAEEPQNLRNLFVCFCLAAFL